MSEVNSIDLLEIDYERVYLSKCGGWIDIHPLHGEEELPDNIEVSIKLADRCYRLELLPVLDSNSTELRRRLLWDVFGTKNPDLRINGKYIADIKTPSGETVTRTAINNAIRRAGQQKVEVAVINLFRSQYSFSQIKEGMRSALQPGRNNSIRVIWIITHDNNLLIIPRKMALTQNFYLILDAL